MTSAFLARLVDLHNAGVDVRLVTSDELVTDRHKASVTELDLLVQNRETDMRAAALRRRWSPIALAFCLLSGTGTVALLAPELFLPSTIAALFAALGCWTWRRIRRMRPETMPIRTAGAGASKAGHRGA